MTDKLDGIVMQFRSLDHWLASNQPFTTTEMDVLRACAQRIVDKVDGAKKVENEPTQTDQAGPG